MQGARLQSIRADLHDGGCRRGSRAAWLAAAICSGAADHRWSRVSCAAAGGRRCAPPHEHPPYPSPTHHTTPERPPLTLRVLRRRRSQAASREEYDLLLLGGAVAQARLHSSRSELAQPAYAATNGSIAAPQHATAAGRATLLRYA